MSDASVIEDIEDKIFHQPENKSDLAKATELLLNDLWKRRKTRLRERVIAKLTTIETISVIYEVQWLKEWVTDYTEYLTSVDGKGRQEIVDITKFSIDKETQMHKELLTAMGRR
jgi:hypothetical protein